MGQWAWSRSCRAISEARCDGRHAACGCRRRGLIRTCSHRFSTYQGGDPSMTRAVSPGLLTARQPGGAPASSGLLVSVNVGLPRDVQWRGRTVHTGVWKHPVDGPHRVRAVNIDGDGQGDLAGHGGPHRAVLVYQLDSYEHWRNELNRDDLSHGQFGENFTVDG